MNTKEKILYLSVAALLIGVGFFPLPTFAFTSSYNRPPDGPSPLIFSVTWDSYDEICQGYLVGTWRVQDADGLWYGSIHPSTTLSVVDETIALSPGEYGALAVQCDPGEFDEGASGVGDIGGGMFTITAAAASGAITIPTSTASSFLGNLTSQLGDLGTILMLAFAASMPLFFYVAHKFIDLLDFSDVEDRILKERSRKAMAKTDQLLGK